MTYAEAIDFLYSLRHFGTKLGLENTYELARLNGNPHKELRFIHVAGTNGKGSTCAILESLYRTHGLKTGLFTSPHLVSFTERIQVNRVCMPEADVVRLTGSIMNSLGGPDASRWPFHPTFFEFITAMALVYFREQRCDLVIWETGLGGRLDATNIVTPLASVITNIQYDHQQWLGHSLEQIAGEKAGIIKPGVPVVTATDEGPALEVIRATAARQQSPLNLVRPNEAFAGQFPDLLKDLPLLGAHQVINAALALAVIWTLSGQFPVSVAKIRKAIQTVHWPGRLQLIRRGSTEILLDGAHNPDGTHSLAAALNQHFAGRRATLVLGLFRDKAWQQMCDDLVPRAHRLLLVPVSSERSADPREVKAYCESRWPQVQITACRNLAEALDQSFEDPFVVITGSLHLIGEAMERLQVTPGVRSERALNDWNAANTGDR